MNDHDFEQRVRSNLREALDRELGPDPTWAESPAAHRVAQAERPARRRWPLRALGVAALVAGTGGAASLLGGGQSELPPTNASASPAEASEAPEDALVSPVELAGVTNGWIAFTVAQEAPAGDDPDLDIWFIALNQEARRVVGTESDNLDQLCPAFAPDGRSLAYASVEGAGDNLDDEAWQAGYRHSTLVIADVADDGTVSDRETIEIGDGLPPACPVWSPDGAEVAFGVPRTSPINPSRSGEGSEVWVVRLEDRRVRVVPDLLATDLDWSPDGSVLAVSGGVVTASGPGVTDGLQDARIHLYSPASDTLRSLEETLGVSSLTWSPNGERIAYQAADGLRVIDVDTGQDDLLAGPYGTLHGIGPVWSPDGMTIAYQRQTSGERHEVVLLSPDERSDQTGLATKVVIPPTRRPGEQLFPFRVTWSPDGEYLLYVAWTGGLPAGIFAVPTDSDARVLLLSDLEGIKVHDGYDDTTFVPIQVWGRGPSE